jgi:hypothetical protein
MKKSIENGNIFAYRHYRENFFSYHQGKLSAHEHLYSKLLLPPISENNPLLLSALRVATASELNHF